MEINVRHGKWLAIYGGAPFLEGKDTIASVMKYLKEDLKCTITAIRVDHFRDEILNPNNREYVHLKKTYAYFPPTIWDPASKSSQFGGTVKTESDSIKLIGNSVVWFGQYVLPHVWGHVVLGGGKISLDNYEYGRFKKSAQIQRPSMVRCMITSSRTNLSTQLAFGSSGVEMRRKMRSMSLDGDGPMPIRRSGTA